MIIRTINTADGSIGREDHIKVTRSGDIEHLIIGGPVEEKPVEKEGLGGLLDRAASMHERLAYLESKLDTVHEFAKTSYEFMLAARRCARFVLEAPEDPENDVGVTDEETAAARTVIAYLEEKAREVRV